ncbi:hypothetical protein GXP67_35370 [Rhodocytophaga rosea]|uniref:CARDB domain-containing protein n=1 Tax=Rhodocytophaga rosea TaxID=2704465 RepID=A0A6C0GUT7_9BACT|nr:CARDB domain-containing protein [Rhodocytophaga rosea]QHT71574.1 hypothetical protein GXP67_35370 [Rhodocytophaga rosea]
MGLGLMCSLSALCQTTVVGKSNRIYVKVSKEPPAQKAELSYSRVIFKDPNKNQSIDPAEETTVDFTVMNEGKAKSQNLLIKAYASNEIKGLVFANEITIEGLEPGKSKEISIPVTGTRSLEAGTANIIVEIRQEYEYDPDQIEINVLTEELKN